MTYQRPSNAPTNALPTLPTGGGHTPPIYPHGVGSANAALESAAALPTPANDNHWDGRSIQAWPTGKRLRQARRDADLYLLIRYRELVDMAFGTPANDNWREAPPAPGEEDGRALEEQINQREMILNEDGIEPGIEEMRELSGVPWGDDPDYDESKPARAKLVKVDRAGTEWRHLGDLEFIDGAYLYRYGDLDNPDRRNLKKPTEKRAPRRPKKLCDPSLVPNTSGKFTLEEQIEARDEVRRIFEKLPASVVRLLEHAVGTTTARQLGEAFGKQGKNAERFGVRLFDWGIGHLREAWRPQSAV